MLRGGDFLRKYISLGKGFNKCLQVGLLSESVLFVEILFLVDIFYDLIKLSIFFFKGQVCILVNFLFQWNKEFELVSNSRYIQSCRFDFIRFIFSYRQI